MHQYVSWDVSVNIGTLLPFLAMREELSPVDRMALINAIAAREGTAKEISKWYAVPIENLRAFVEENKPAIEHARELLERSKEETHKEPSPAELDSLWVTQKVERLARYQKIADILYRDLTSEKQKLYGSDLSTAAREFRSYLTVVANELGQLLHRGSGDSGDGDTVSYDIQGVDINSLR
jgi:hypothetical protein